MKELVNALKETIDINNDKLIQFQIDGRFYELDKNKNGEWKLTILLGPQLKLSTKRLLNKSKEEVIKILKDQYKNVRIY